MSIPFPGASSLLPLLKTVNIFVRPDFPMHKAVLTIPNQFLSIQMLVNPVPQDPPPSTVPSAGAIFTGISHLPVFEAFTCD